MALSNKELIKVVMRYLRQNQSVILSMTLLQLHLPHMHVVARHSELRLQSFRFQNTISDTNFDLSVSWLSTRFSHNNWWQEVIASVWSLLFSDALDAVKC
ncbi:hypothetical protein GLYMA_05G210200v4 [Glycine max]|uniref:Uncharacterized protein n=1 Tax=Glycine max TaxID=3847 RepID=A0A0R0JZ75_SOYBN|nr:hypothetical protein JHK85_013949 [Glycine max]KAH1135560.1 hypothetical protein GYH30_013341 [Glycine max]KRH59949.1 hypothetical protein GLYMA_05G210200v4 [Glycine max]